METPYRLHHESRTKPGLSGETTISSAFILTACRLPRSLIRISGGSATESINKPIATAPTPSKYRRVVQIQSHNPPSVTRISTAFGIVRIRRTAPGHDATPFSNIQDEANARRHWNQSQILPAERQHKVGRKPPRHDPQSHHRHRKQVCCKTICGDSIEVERRERRCRRSRNQCRQQDSAAIEAHATPPTAT